MNFIDKISYLEAYLNEEQNSYADSFKTEMSFYFDDFNPKNRRLQFLNNLHSETEIKARMDALTSKLVLKFEEKDGDFGEFVSWFLG